MDEMIWLESQIDWCDEGPRHPRDIFCGSEPVAPDDEHWSTTITPGEGCGVDVDEDLEDLAF